jgi:hypothetical protein
MEKHNIPPLSALRAATGPRREEPPCAAPKSRAVRSAVVAVVVCLGLARGFGVFAPTERAPLTVAERATAILKENPLIGQSARARAQPWRILTARRRAQRPHDLYARKVPEPHL